MISFHEYAAWRQQAGLPSPEGLLALLGISPGGPHEIDVMRLVKDEKRRAAQKPSTTSTGIPSTKGRKGLPRPGMSAL